MRAIAVLAVVLFHAGIPAFGGGFTGVDIFFVISGFLITRLIVDDLRSGSFRFGDFYKRRALRILPALLAMLAATSIAGYIILMPSEMAALGHSVIASALFYSNEFFRLSTDYFAASVYRFPLLHTWSLSVEEQFYIVFPFLLMLLHRYLRRWPALGIAVLVVTSFALSAITVQRWSVAAFFLLPTRMWEFGLGALIAVGGVPLLHSRPMREAAAATGVALMLFGVFYLTDDMVFPGWNALYPCAGAALVIAYSEGTLISWALSVRPAVFIGRISYSLYLWHWPVLTFYMIYYGGYSNAMGRLSAVALSFIIAVGSYYFVETPFRTGTFRLVSARRVLAGSGAVLATVAAAGVAMVALRPTFDLYPPEVRGLAAYADYGKSPDYTYQFRRYSCFVDGSSDGEDYDRAECMRIVDGKKNYLVIGDSHAAHLWRALALEFEDVNFIQTTIAGCRPVLNGSGARKCRELVDYALTEFIGAGRIDGVVMAGRWQERDLTALDGTIRTLKQRLDDVIVVGPTAEYQAEVPLLLAKKTFHDLPLLTSEALVREIDGIDRRVEAVATAAGARFASIYRTICPGACIEETPAGVPLQFDGSHLTLAGARHVVGLMHEQVEPR
mgnify:CR=1 FL=1